ncbi:hypothetical protein [Flavobacterium restrictum]|uniref:Uncharacterized protein n=1 Tax=Flavobacterium restrictum TaxID=2594428 RepID=A0A553DSI5_9FLAO|nr:hypothetical protein [Flavobacterium restrictum]TRX35689.1 hypothetical protein FNW21_14565 [Flavobacterium restrictum]
MNIKRIFGVLLTLLGIAALIYTATLFLNSVDSDRDIKMLVIYGVLGVVFFVSGMGLIKTIKDES